MLLDARGDSWRWAAVATLPALLLLAWQASFVWPFFSDDAFISLRYSDRLLAGHGLTWTDGERVEGYSNLLWVLGCAGLGSLGLDLVTAARALGALASAVAMLALARALRPHDAASTAVAACAPLLAASTQVALGWTCSGLEGPLVLCWLALGFARLLRLHPAERANEGALGGQLLVASVPFALLCLTRPDGPLWVATTAIALALAHWRDGLLRMVQRAGWFAALPIAAFTAQLAFRVIYYGDLVPNTAHVKAGFDPDAWPAGLAYVGGALLAHAGLVLPAGIAAVWLLRRRTSSALALVLCLPLLAWFVYLIAIGGDHFPGRRLLHGAVAPLALLATVGAATVPGRARLLGAVVLLLGSAWNVQLARGDAQSHELRAEIWEWAGREVGAALGTAFAAQRPLLAVDAAGAIPYYSGLPSLDLLGLCDRTIATTPLPAWLATVVPGTPRPPGHLRGNGRYVLDRAPDLFVFGPPPGRPLPVFVSGAELEDDPRFLEGYRLVLLDLGTRTLLPELRAPVLVPLWVRLDGKAGIGRSAERIVIPAWLFSAFALHLPLVRRYQPPTGDAAASAQRGAHYGELVAWLGNPGNAAVPDAAGLLRARLTQRRTTLRVELPAGSYRARIEPAAPGLQVSCATADANDAPGQFVVTTAGWHELVLQIAEDVALPAQPERIELQRLPQ